MKYNVLFGLAALALGFTACDDIEESDSLPQSNPQLEIVAASGVTLDKGSAAASTIDLASQLTINIATVAGGADWPEGFTPMVYSMQFAANDQFADPHTIDAATTEEGVVTVNPNDFEVAYVEAFGKNPSDRQLYVRFPVYAVKGQQIVRMGGENVYYGGFPVTVKPMDQFGGQRLEDAYYLINNVDNWDFSKAIALVHSGADVYDDPVFTLSITVPSAGYQWAIIPESTRAAGSLGLAYGVADPTAKEGSLVAVAGGQSITYGVIDLACPTDFRFNMLDLTYEYKGGYEMLYTPGNSNGWNQGASQTLTTSDYVTYTGYAHLDGEYKLTSQPDWNGNNYGDGGKNEAGENLLSLSGGNLVAPGNALYWMEVNLAELTYKDPLEITTIGLIGDATPDGWNGDTALTPSADFLQWSATVTLTTGEFKFRMNGGWDLNLGGDTFDNLTQDGPNCKVTAAGTYVVTLDLSARPYSCTLAPQP